MRVPRVPDTIASHRRDVEAGCVLHSAYGVAGQGWLPLHERVRCSSLSGSEGGQHSESIVAV